MKRVTLLAFLLPLLMACGRKEESPASAPAPEPSASPGAGTAGSTEPRKNATEAPATEPAKPAGAKTSGSSSGASGEYTVVDGDTLSGIARAHGVSRDDLVRWNNIQNPDRIQPGQTLRLSEPGS